MDAAEIQSDLEAIERDATLLRDSNLARRIQSIDYIEFDIGEQIEGLASTHAPGALARLSDYANGVRDKLEQANRDLFARLRAEIANGTCTGDALAARFIKYTGRDSRQDPHHDRDGYDSLDVLVAGILLSNPAPRETKKREVEMVRYQPTPARVILELVERVHLGREDVFYDVGSGLGQVSILVHLLSGATAKGIEFEPVYCDYARACATKLNLASVQFANIDARDADYADGTIFFFYTPFTGNLLDQVLDRLWRQTRGRTIMLCTYGPCTPQVARQSWLEHLDGNGLDEDKLAVFRSRGR